MRSMGELIPIITSYKIGDENLYKELSTQELKLVISYFIKLAGNSIVTDSFKSYIEIFTKEINKRIIENRNNKINQLVR
jgi:hypothetical protein